MIPTFALRPARASDVGFLTGLEALVMQDHAVALWGRFRPAEPPSAFDLANTRIVGVGESFVGYIMIEATPDHLRLRKLYLVPDWQGRGLGAHLLTVAKAEATAAALPLRLSVLRPNRRAVSFYLREGFRVADQTDDRVFLSCPWREVSHDPVL